MPVKHAAFKSLKKAIKRTAFNKKRLKFIKSLRKKITKLAVAKEKDKIPELSKKFQQAVDKAVKQHILKKNTAIRYKSRLAKFIKKQVA